MTYIKYKELSKYFDFSVEMDLDNLPTYVTDYVDGDEKIVAAYKAKRDKGVFTSKKIILFDLDPLGRYKKIHIFPYYSISTAAIVFKSNKAEIQLSLDSGYQLRLIFVRMDPNEKTRLRILYTQMMKESMKKWK